MRLVFAISYLTVVAFGQTPTPSIVSAQPNPVNAGDPAFTLTVTGSGFASGAVVKWSGTALITTFVSEGLMTATVPASLIAICGKFPLTVSAPGGVTSTGTYFVTVNPVLSSLSPNTAPAGSSGFTILALGQGFSSNVVLALNSGGRTTLIPNYISTSTLSAFIPASALTGVYPVSLQVTDPTTGGTSQKLDVTLSYADIVKITPQTIDAGGPGFTLFVEGINFDGGAQVLWNGTPLVTRVQDSKNLNATVPASLYHDAAGAQVGISVKNPGTAPTKSLPLIVRSNPFGTTITSLVPATAVTGGPSFVLTVIGERFVQGSTIIWQTTPLPTTFVSATQLTATIPASLFATDGAAAITVSTPGLTASNLVNLPIVSTSPTVVSITPVGVPAGGPGFTLTVNGTGFVPASRLIGLVGATTSYVSTTQLTASVPAGAIASVGTFLIQVSNPSGIISPQGVTFTVKAPIPVLSRLSPASAPAGGPDLTLTLTGTDFTANATVAWNGAPLGTTRVSSTQLTAMVPAALIAAPGTASVTVSSGSSDGSVPSNALNFAITGAAPSILSLNPSSAIAGGAAFTLTVNGTGFAARSTVQWNGTALSTTFTSAFQLTANVPATLIATAATASVTVTGDGGTSNPAAFAIATVLPAISTAGIVNAASSAPAMAPGTLISIYGSNLASGDTPAQTIPLLTSLGGTTVSINGTAAPLLFVSPGQINAQIPYEIATGRAKLVVRSNGVASAEVNFEVATTGPGVFALSPTNHVVAVNLPESALNGAQAPALPGQYVTLYATGQGALDNGVASGVGAPGSPLSRPLAPVEVRIGNQLADIQFAGLAPGFVGLLQINVKIPDGAAGEQPVDVSIGGVKASTTVISVGAR